MGFLSRGNKSAPPPPDAKKANLSVAVLLSDMVLLDLGDFKRYYKAVCGSRASCKEIPASRKDVGEFQRLELESDGRTMIMSLRSGPLPPNLVDMMGRMTQASIMGTDLTHDEAQALKNHKAHAVIGCTTVEDKADPQRSINQAWLIAETLLTLFEHKKEFVGYAPLSAQMYRPREWLVARLKEGKIAQSDLFILLGNIQLFRGEPNWMYTLGMEQFGQPDFEVWFTDPDKARLYVDLLGNAALYSISESVLSLGNTFEIQGDPTKYKLVPSKEVSGHRWGAFGAMGLEPVTRT